MNKKISIIVPMYYEEDVANETYNRLTNVLKNIKSYEYEILFINDGSRDNTLNILKEISNKDKNIKII